MNVPTQLAARDEYETETGLPPAGSRVWINGFPRHEHDEAARLLGLHGLKASAFASGADAMLVPGPPSPEMAAEAERTGRRLLVPDDLRTAVRSSQRRTAIEVSDDAVRILDVTLPRRAAGGRRVPPAEQFAHLCLDSLFLKAARAVAIAASAGLPCALEGETAVAKSTAVLWVAWLCRQGAVRLNLNGQSDAGELVGRFVPNGDSAEPGDHRPPAAWRFWEGIVPDCMRHGHWVVLDELNLAEPQVLERLNPVLESPPTLVLAENRGERFGPGGDVPVADSFRIFATMNPVTVTFGIHPSGLSGSEFDDAREALIIDAHRTFTEVERLLKRFGTKRIHRLFEESNAPNSVTAGVELAQPSVVLSRHPHQVH